MRQPGQIWVAYMMESPAHYPLWRDPTFMNRFDLVMSHERSADIWTPYLPSADAWRQAMAKPVPAKTELAPVVLFQSANVDRNGRNDFAFDLMKRSASIHTAGCFTTATSPDPISAGRRSSTRSGAIISAVPSRMPRPRTTSPRRSSTRCSPAPFPSIAEPVTSPPSFRRGAGGHVHSSSIPCWRCFPWRRQARSRALPSPPRSARRWPPPIRPLPRQAFPVSTTPPGMASGARGRCRPTSSPRSTAVQPRRPGPPDRGQARRHRHRAGHRNAASLRCCLLSCLCRTEWRSAEDRGLPTDLSPLLRLATFRGHVGYGQSNKRLLPRRKADLGRLIASLNSAGYRNAFSMGKTYSASCT